MFSSKTRVIIIRADLTLYSICLDYTIVHDVP